MGNGGVGSLGGSPDTGCRDVRTGSEVDRKAQETLQDLAHCQYHVAKVLSSFLTYSSGLHSLEIGEGSKVLVMLLLIHTGPEWMTSLQMVTRSEQRARSRWWS